jgi:lauroyl/myristoyl acyltransferase
VSIDFYRWVLIDILSRALSLRFGYALAGLVARIMYFTDPRGRAAVMSNIGRILASDGRQCSKKKLQRMGRETYRNFGKYLIEFFKIRGLAPPEVRRMVRIEGEEHVRAALATGRGIIALTAHIGNWEIGGTVMATLGYPLHAVFLPLRDPRTAALWAERRRQKGYRIIPFGRAAAQVLSLLRNGKLVGMVADIDFSLNDDVMDFFGHPARLPAGPARIALKTDAVVLPAFIVRMPDNTFLFRFHEPIDPRAEGSVRAVRERIREVLEKELVANPTQWFVFVDFWDHAETRRLGVEGVG